MLEGGSSDEPISLYVYNRSRTVFAVLRKHPGQVAGLRWRPPFLQSRRQVSEVPAGRLGHLHGSQPGQLDRTIAYACCTTR